jgi:hypothetical protein
LRWEVIDKEKALVIRNRVSSGGEAGKLNLTTKETRFLAPRCFNCTLGRWVALRWQPTLQLPILRSCRPEIDLICRHRFPHYQDRTKRRLLSTTGKKYRLSPTPPARFLYLPPNPPLPNPFPNKSRQLSLAPDLKKLGASKIQNLPKNRSDKTCRLREYLRKPVLQHLRKLRVILLV